MMTELPQTPRAVLADFAAFVKAPRFVPAAGLGAPGAWRAVGTMLALNIAGLFAMLPLLHLWQQHFGLSGPSGYEDMELATIAPLVVLAAPVIEECLFRGWLSGRPRALWLIVAAIVFGTAIVGLRPEGPPLLALVGGALVALPLGWFVLRKRATPQWFERRFVWFLYASVALFALVHLLNYPNPGAPYLPMVLPQLWAGFTLAWVRTRIALPASMLVHGVSNAAALGLALVLG